MKKTKRSPFMRIAGFMLAVSLLMTCVISSTMAKYTSAATDSDTATVAKWSVKVNGSEIAVSPAATVDFGLFDTVKDSNGTDEETDVATGKIAPGTSGEFTLTIENSSEVNAQYAIDFTVTNDANIPLEFSADGTEWKTSLEGVTDTIAMSATATKTIYWRWAFEQTDVATGDAADTALGIAAPTVTVSATITATQVD